ncbi:MAG TPA: hypothetical protein VES67_06745 [Vicinamibacterales bacterium]|nr:hypothetical protein [Vicinamibacterales bacterium]
MPSPWIVVVSVGLLGQSTPAQDPHARGATVMGFDQHKTAHHFYLHDDGGAIDIAVKNASDTADRDDIRAHLPHIAQMFGAGNFEASMLIHDSKNVPGTSAMTKLKGRITYKYKETPGGGRVDITTADPAAVAAVHEFLKYQIAEHKTGDPGTVSKRK